jgi:hypothetical protein
MDRLGRRGVASREATAILRRANTVARADDAQWQYATTTIIMVLKITVKITGRANF